MDYNILIADFAGKNRICMTDMLYQYDYGQKLQIESIPALPQTFEAHFSNVNKGGVSLTVAGIDGVVDIPNSLLMTGKRIYCWIYVTEPGSGETEYQVLIPVQARPMPEYYDVTDVGVFDSVVQQVGDYAATATAGATSATASAAAAATSEANAADSASAAETAKTAAETAQGKAEDAQTAAETAAQTATEKAQQTAQDAAQAASDAGRAESAARRAEAAQTGAESAKTDAETAAQGAADSALAVSASASSAGQAATSAAQSATAAAGSATTAGNAAQTATTKAGEASASATAAAASATSAQTAQTAAETAATNAGQFASTATAKAAEAATSASGAAQSKTDAEAAAARAEQAAATLTVDTALSDSSTNPVQNKVITAELTDVKSQLNANVEGILSGTKELTILWEDGGFYTSTGLKNTSTSATYPYSNRTVNSFSGDGRTYIFSMSGNGSPKLQIYEYNLSGTYIGLAAQLSGDGASYTFATDRRYNLAFIDISNVERPSLSNLSIGSSMELTYVPAVIVSEFDTKENLTTAQSIRKVDTFDLLEFCTLELGGLTAEGADVSHSYRIRTAGYVEVSDVTSMRCTMQSGYILYIYGFDANKNFTSVLGNWLTGTKIVDVSSAVYIRMMLMKSSGELSFDEISNYSIRASYLLKDRLDSLYYSANIPDYWTAYLPNKINTINGKMDSCALSGDGFVFITDYHIENNRAMSHWLVKFITEHTSVKDVVFGGDILNGSTTHDDAYAKIKEAADRFAIIDRFYFLRGNHDYNLNDGGSVAEKITDSELYNLMMKRSEYLVSGNPGNLYYYRDNDKQHIRYIYLDSRYENSTDPIDDDQLDWMKARISELDATWNVVVLTHELFGTDVTSYNPSGTKIVAALNSVKQTAQATIPCVIAGHTHKDINKTDNGTVMIGVGCDTMQSFSGTDRQAGTTTEQLFDVFSIDTASRKIYATRIGYGSDREFSY